MTFEEQNELLERFISPASMTLLILSLLNEEKECTGYSIIQKIRKKTNNSIKLHAGTLYPRLDNMIADGTIIKIEIDVKSKSREGFIKKNVYRITHKGKELLSMEWTSWELFIERMNSVRYKQSEEDKFE